LERVSRIQERKEMKVSLIASSIRYELYKDFMESLENTSVDYEVIFAGNRLPRLQDVNIKLTYIETKNIKPCQCYEIARREANGECVMWVADDCEFVGDIVGKAYKYWKEQNNKKLILSLQTKEYYMTDKVGMTNMKLHTFVGGRRDTPLMAPLALMSREYLQELGGFDNKYICGQYENQCVIMAMMNGGKVEIFGDKTTYIDIDHIGKFERITGKKGDAEHRKRPFASGYSHDRKVLESYCKINDGKIDIVGEFNPYYDKDILTKSQSFNGEWK